jgi:short-subunit dehydrogenase
VKTEFSEHTGAKRKTGRTTPAALRLDAWEVAEAVLSLVRRPRRGLVIPWPMHLAIWVNAIFPGLVDRLIEQKFTRPERGF